MFEEYVDHGISGAKGRDKRPAFDGLCKAATRKEFDLIAAWSVDRLGRSLQHLANFVVNCTRRMSGYIFTSKQWTPRRPPDERCFR